MAILNILLILQSCRKISGFKFLASTTNSSAVSPLDQIRLRKAPLATSSLISSLRVRS